MGKRNGLDRQNVKAGENAVRDDMRETVIKNGIYRHYKGGIYEVTNIARHSESLEELVIYKNVVSEDCWARPVSMWNETIEQDGIKLPRFHFVAADLDSMDAKPLFQTIEDIYSLTEENDRLSDDNNFGFCKKSTGEVLCVDQRVMACFEGDIDETELLAWETESLKRLDVVMENSGDVVSIPQEGFLDAYEVMESFAYSIPGPYQDKLLDALQGKGAFRRFRDTVNRLNIAEHWYTYRVSRLRREIRTWCDVMGIDWTKTYIINSKER